MKLELFFSKFDEFTDMPNAVSKMRGLILQLASHGKLVAQSSDDEPAHVLVKRIEKHIEELRSHGAFRGAPVEPLNREELPRIPSNWEWVRLGNVVAYGSPDKNESADIPEDAWLLDLEDIEKDTSRLLQRKRFRDSPSKSTKTAFATGDVLYGKLRPYLNKVIVADATGYCTTEIIPIRTFGFIDPAYLCYALKRPEFIAYANSKSYGMNLPRLGTEDARSAPFPLPPLAEQTRIVAKVDELMVLCDRLEEQQRERAARHAALIRASLARFAEVPTPANLNFLFHDSYAVSPADVRKSILTLAVQGKLVPQDPNGQSAEDYARLCDARKKTQLKITQIDDEASADHPAMPDSWLGIHLGELVSIRTGFAFKSGDYAESGTFILRVTNINSDGSFDTTKSVFLPESKMDKKMHGFLLEENELLVVMVGGSLGKIGRVTREILPALLNQNMWRLRPYGEQLDIGFLRLVLTDLNENRLQITDSTHGHLAMGVYAASVVPFPPFAEQRRIVAKVDELMALVDALESQLATAHTIGEKLLDATVAELAQAA